jgi:hypothetical protein
MVTEYQELTEVEEEVSDEFVDSIKQEIGELNEADGIPTREQLNADDSAEAEESDDTDDDSPEEVEQEEPEIPAHIQARFDQYQQEIDTLKRDDEAEQERAKAQTIRHIQSEARQAVMGYMVEDNLSREEAEAKVAEEVRQAQAAGEFAKIAQAYGVRIDDPQAQAQQQIDKRFSSIESKLDQALGGNQAPAGAAPKKVAPRKPVTQPSNAPRRRSNAETLGRRYRDGDRSKEVREYARSNYA